MDCKMTYYITYVLLIFSVNTPQLNGQFPEEINLADFKSNAKNGTVRTYISGLEHLFQDIGSIIPNNDTFIGKSFSDILSLFGSQFQALFPGTYWCGSGNSAQDFEDLGLFYKTDKCCRNHDSCPNDILAGQSLGPLLNNGIFTRSSCACDHAFNKCLNMVKSVIATSIGDTYFNILRPQCFANNYPIIDCAEYSSGFNIMGSRKCIKYKLDKRQNKTLEWFDNPDY